MPSPFDRAIRRANGALYRAAGKPVTYTAGAMVIEIPQALQGSTAAELNDLNGVSVRMLQTDWLVPISALVFEGQPIEPQPGDTIDHTDGDVIYHYEVQNLGTERCYRISGPLRDRYRIHVRTIGETAVQEDPEVEEEDETEL